MSHPPKHDNRINNEIRGNTNLKNVLQAMTVITSNIAVVMSEEIAHESVPSL